MNLFTPGTGFYETHVTWEDIENDMQRELSTSAPFGPNKSVKDLGDGKGFMSKLLLIEADWQHQDMELPKKFILKIITPSVWLKYATEASKDKNTKNRFCDESPVSDFTDFLKKAHNAEVACYRHLMKLPKGKVCIPKIYFMQNFTEHNQLKGYIIMEYLESAEVDIMANFSIKQVRQILRFKAVLEATSIDVPPEERNQFFDDVFQTVGKVFFSDEELRIAITALRSMEGGRFADKADQLEKIIPDLVDNKWVDNLPEEFEMDRVLCHGDFYPPNTIWKLSNNELSLTAVIDYQCAHFGCSAVDLVQISIAFLSGKDRRAHWEELLEDFYGYVQEEVGNGKMPYTLEKLKEAYRQFFPTGAFIFVPFIEPLLEIINKDKDEEHRKECYEMTLEKLECMLDDIFYYHDRNIKIRKRQ
uniref:CHK domain-containing protein n=1 Tax=Haemonchus contortus TaxID=6289 RepID=A0A7I4YXQ0_HAECO